MRNEFSDLRAAPRRLGLPPIPTPTSPALAEIYYPRALQIAQEAAQLFGVADKLPPVIPGAPGSWADVPDATFTGPY